MAVILGGSTGDDDGSMHEPVAIAEVGVGARLLERRRIGGAARVDDAAETKFRLRPVRLT